jgi:hypothetical protein
VLNTKDRLEGLAAFAEKRKPRYTGEWKEYSADYLVMYLCCQRAIYIMLWYIEPGGKLNENLSLIFAPFKYCQNLKAEKYRCIIMQLETLYSQWSNRFHLFFSFNELAVLFLILYDCHKWVWVCSIYLQMSWFRYEVCILLDW